ncbi:DUF2243 domain-containing protein [Sphingosinicella sp. CPCC 101087]|uniref:DUF2243 domain-containing protein n=1 Tax=Sphingosinicella sp. CPCC 101087 TaxID=2497754 RepID=UPI00101C3679|nr:DUF2243 domain-containing protein [Sphingosinicella sp. CPCC 101087]
MSPKMRAAGRLRWSAYCLGFALGGFFDGILLHQILQWHHLLSLVPGVGSIADQIFFDGLFHALMYLVAAVGLTLLARSGAVLGAPGTGRFIFANALIGFGFWHVVDAVVSHWVLGIHRINLASSNPLLWDLAWFALFGLAPVLSGWLLRRGQGPGGSGTTGRAAALGIALCIAVAAPWAALPPAEARSAIVLFRPDLSDGQAVNAIRIAGADILWQSRGAWAVRWRDEPRPGRLYEEGAMLVSTSLAGAGCLAWTKSW